MAFLFIKLNANLLADRAKTVEYVNKTIQQTLPRLVPVGSGKIEVIEGNVDRAERIVLAALNGNSPQPNLASEETMKKELSKYSEKEKAEYDRKIKGFLNSVVAVKDPVFQPGETLEKEWFTFFESVHGNKIPKGTGAFIRETNFSRYCYIFPHVLMVRSSISQKLLPDVRIQYEETGSNKNKGLRNFAKMFAEGLVSGIGKAIGANLFGSIFGDGEVPSYFDEVYKEIEKIMKKEITQQTIDEVNGAFNGFQIYIKDEYCIRKDKTKDYTELFAELKDQMHKHFQDTIGTLTYGGYQIPGFGTFMIGAGMHLSALQELALIDPNVKDPHNSVWVDTLKAYAKDYVAHADKTMTDIEKKRSGMIKAKEQTAGAWIIHYEYKLYWWEDEYSGEKSPVYNSGKDWFALSKRNDSMTKHRNNVLQSIRDGLGQPWNTIEDWKKLQDQPLPI